MDIAKLKAENEALKQDLTRLENDYARLRQVKAQLEFQLAELQRLIFSSRLASAVTAWVLR